MVYRTTYNIRGVTLSASYSFDEVFEEVIIERVELTDSDEDIYELLGESDKEEIMIKCMQHFQENR